MIMKKTITNVALYVLFVGVLLTIIALLISAETDRSQKIEMVFLILFTFIAFRSAIIYRNLTRNENDKYYIKMFWLAFWVLVFILYGSIMALLYYIYKYNDTVGIIGTVPLVAGVVAGIYYIVKNKLIRFM